MLRRAREEKQITLDQLSRATKISKTNLTALEAGDFDRLPAPIYTRGFLRAYAREVGLDPEEVVELYMRQVEEAEDELAGEQPSADATEVRSASTDRVAERGSAAGPIPLRIQIDLSNLRLPRPAVAATVVIAFLAVLAVLIWRGGTGGEEVTSAADERNAAAAAAEAAAVDTPAPPDVVRAAHDEEQALRIELRTTGLCWIEARADQTPVIRRLMQPGETEVIEALDDLVIRIGDPSALTMTINGSPVRTLGEPEVPVTLRITRDNYRQLLAS
jgi:cytoskeletal protein RodZ